MDDFIDHFYSQFNYMRYLHLNLRNRVSTVNFSFYGLFYGAVSIWTTLNGGMTYKLERVWKEAVVA
jgi:hypothetical protein